MATQPILESDYAHLVSPAALAVQITRGSAAPYIPARHHRFISDKLVRLHRRREGDRRRLMLMVPPQHGKSTLASYWFPVWNLALDDTTKIILTSYGLSLASTFGRASRRTVEANYPILGADIVEDSRASWRWKTRAGGGMECRGVGGGISGLGFDLGIVDDPIKDAQEAQSKKVRDAIWDWWEQAFLTRRGPDSIIVVIMTRWHEDDLCGRLLKTEPELWDVVRLPAFAESGDPLGRAPGERLWPERYSQEFYEDIRRKRSRVFNALYQQRPSGLEGSGIERSWWSYYTERQDPASFDRIILSWDTTFKDVDSADFVAGGAIGIRGEDMYLLDAEHARLNAPKTMRAIRAMRARNPSARRVLIEDSANGPAIMQMMEHEISGLTPVSTGGRSKEVRLSWGVNSASGYIEEGHFFLPRLPLEAELEHRAPMAVDCDQKVCEIAARLVDEAAEFPYGDHDDILDMVVQAVTHLMPATWSARRKAAARLASEIPVDYAEALRKRLLQAVQDRRDREMRDKLEADREARQHGLARAAAAPVEWQ